MIKAALSFVLTCFRGNSNGKMIQTSVLTLTTRSIVPEVEAKAAPGLQLLYLTLRIDVHVGVIGALPLRTPLIMLYMNMIVGVTQGTLPLRTSL